MTIEQIIDELKRLPTIEVLRVIEAATRRVMEEIKEGQLESDSPLAARLTKAAEALREDYATDGDLIAFTALDSEEFIHASG
ncbi:MAG: hypothetical protein FJ030_18525 [Chloroflexi bacterium]|nr:hypothetical protein [Chloroflexota bacterium]